MTRNKPGRFFLVHRNMSHLGFWLSVLIEAFICKIAFVLAVLVQAGVLNYILRTIRQRRHRDLSQAPSRETEQNRHGQPFCANCLDIEGSCVHFCLFSIKRYGTRDQMHLVRGAVYIQGYGDVRAHAWLTVHEVVLCSRERGEISIRSFLWVTMVAGRFRLPWNAFYQRYCFCRVSCC